MRPHKTLLALALSAIMTAIPAVYAVADGVAPVSLSRGRISGEKVEYVIYLPNFWAGYLSADRETRKTGDPVLERIIFKYIPQDSKTNPVFLMNLYVYNKRQWKETAQLRKIFETEDFVFAHEYAAENNLANETDNVIYGRLLNEASNTEYVAGFIRLPDDQKIILSNTVTVNGRKLKCKTVETEGGAVYVPLREACDELGYEVGWLGKEKAATISREYDGKPNFYYMILTAPSLIGRGFYITVIDGKSYVPSLFFTQILNASVEIDENYNVFINGH